MMALATSRVGTAAQACMKNWLSSKSKLFVASPLQIATMKATYGEKYPYAKPWPYETRKFNVFWDMIDVNSRDRLNENSKVICVEGNIGVGKNEFAKRLAREFDLKYIPSVRDDAIFSHKYGVDERMLDPMVSKGAQCYDLKKFLNDPNLEHGKASLLQQGYLQLKYFQYANALLHVLHTGQGVVIARSAWSDTVFLEALRDLRWVTRNYRSYYYEIHDQSYCDLLRPHVTIYLDAPVDVCMQRIQQRIKDGKSPSEVGGEKNLAKLLPAIEKHYKPWLKKQRYDHVVLEVDWSEVGDSMDMDVIAEEMESLNLDCFNADDQMFKDWYRWTEDEMCNRRQFYANLDLMNTFFNRFPPWDAPEAMLASDVQIERDWVMKQHPGFRYPPGTAREFGHRPEWHYR